VDYFFHSRDVLMNFELLDVFIISVILVFSLLFVYRRLKEIFSNKDVSQCNGCADSSCNSKDGLKEKPSCQINQEIK